MPIPIPITPQRVLDVMDKHGTLLAEFDFFPEQQLLWVRWFGYLTQEIVVEVTEAGVALRTHGLAPQRLLSDESQATGDWHEALPWMQYHWLPDAVQQGLQAMAFVLSRTPTSAPNYWGFLQQARLSIAYEVFPTPQAAWHWLVRQGNSLA